MVGDRVVLVSMISGSLATSWMKFSPEMGVLVLWLRSLTTVAAVKTEVESEPSPVKRLLDAFKDGSSLDVILNGRLSIYKSYINKLNYKGHKRFGKKVDGLYVVNAHNNVIQIAFTYGILAAIPYVLICIFSFLRSIQYYRKFHDTNKNACFPILITTAFLLTSLTECILIPMQSLLAFAFFISLGELMNTKQKQRT